MRAHDLQDLTRAPRLRLANGARQDHLALARQLCLFHGFRRCKTKVRHHNLLLCAFPLNGRGQRRWTDGTRQAAGALSGIEPRRSHGLARLVASLMALQAKLPALDFSALDAEGRDPYIAGIHAAPERNYGPLTSIFEKAIDRTKKLAASRNR